MDERVKTFVSNAVLEMPKMAEEALREVGHQRFFVEEIRDAWMNSGQRFLLVIGLRGTGKTTALFQLYMEKAGKDIAYLSCDELLTREISLEDAIAALDFIHKESVGVSKDFTLFLDEITYLPRWDLRLKVLHGKRPRLRVVATSSSALPLKKTTELARRAYNISIFPLSFREYLALHYGIKIPSELTERIHKKIGKESLDQEYLEVRSLLGTRNLFALYEEFMRRDLPFGLKLTEHAYANAVNLIVKRTIYEDFPKYEKLEAKMLMAADIMINYLSTVPADGVKIQTISEVANISKESVAKLLEMFELAMVIRGVEHSGRNRMYKKPKKWFFYSPSMRFVLASPVAHPPEIVGNLREDSVFRHLAAMTPNLFYSHEADFLADTLKIEVGKGKKSREDMLLLEMDESIGKNKIPIPLFALGV